MATDGTILDTIVTDTNGEAKSKLISVEDLGKSGYIIEKGKLAGYKENTTKYPININSDSTIKVQLFSQTIVNEKEPPKLKLEKVNTKGEPVAATFKVTRTGSAVSNTFTTTKENNVVDLSSALPTEVGSYNYTIEETSTENKYQTISNISFTYNVPTVGTPTITNKVLPEGVTFDDDTMVIRVENKLKAPKLRIKKVGPNGEPVEATFEVRAKLDTESVSQVVKTSKTDGFANINLEQFYSKASERMTYTAYITETAVESPYKILDKDIQFQFAKNDGNFYLYTNNLNNENATVEGNDSDIIIKVKNDIEDNHFYIQKTVKNQNHNVNASINMEFYKKGTKTDPVLTTPTFEIGTKIPKHEITEYFNRLSKDNDAAYDVYITETEVTSLDGDYLKLDKFKAFTYYPNNPKEEKFVFHDNHVQCASIVEENKETVFNLILNNEPSGKVTIKKVDEDDNNIVVKGATFKLVNRLTGALIGTKTTNSDGIAVFENVPLVSDSDTTQGHYYIEEITPGENHILPETTRKDFDLTEDDANFEITFANPPIKGDIEIVKVDKDDPNQKLSNAAFELYAIDDTNKPLKTAITDADGKAVFKDCRYGEYVIKETTSPDNYYNDLENGGNDDYWDANLKGYVVKVDENKKVIGLTITNEKRYVEIEVVKVNEENKRLPGATFKIVSTRGVVLDTIVTDTNGEAKSKLISIEELGKNGYVIEAGNLPGYQQDRTKHFIDIDSNDTIKIQKVPLQITNKKEPPQLKLEKVGADGKPAAATFKVTRSDLAIPKMYTTSIDNNVIDLSSLLPTKEGSYDFTIEETSTENKYDTVGKISFTYNVPLVGTPKITNKVLPPYSASFNNNTMSIRVINPYTLPRLRIKKVGPNGEPVEATFEIRVKWIDDVKQVVKTSKTDGYAEINLKEFYDNNQFEPRNTYTAYIKETEVVGPYKILEEEIQFQLAKAEGQGYYLFTDDLKNDNATVEGTLPDIVIRIKDEKEDNHFYIQKEVENPEHSVKASIKMEFYKKGTRINPVLTTPEFDIGTDVSKTDITDYFNALPIEADSAYDVYITETKVTSSKGEYQKLDKFKAFTYYPNKTSEEKFVFHDKHINCKSIDETGETKSFNLALTNDLKPLKIKIRKVDEITNAPVSGAGFEIKTAEGETYNIVTSGSSNGDDKTIPYTESVTIKETQAAPGYIFNSNTATYTVKEDFDEIIENGEVIGYQLDIKITNKRSYGAQIRKYDEFGNVANATFKIKYYNESTPSNYYTKEYNTDKGILDLSPLLMEIYNNYGRSGLWHLEVYETATENGLVVDSSQIVDLAFQTAFIDYVREGFLYIISDNGNVELTSYDDNGNYNGMFPTIKIRNRNVPIHLTVKKKDKFDGKPLAGAEFTIKPKGKKEVVLTTSDAPTGAFVKLPYAESYTVQETKAPAGYILDATVYTYTIDDFDKTDGTIATYNKTIELSNEPYNGNLEITKLDAVSKEKISGATFELYKGKMPTGNSEKEKYDSVKNGADYTLERTIVIPESGTAVVKNLPFGEYVLKETVEPKDHELTYELKSVIINEHAKTMYIDVENNPVSGEIEVYKYDGATNEPLANAEFALYRKDNNEKIGDNLITDETGRAVVENLPYGSYYIKEVRFPAGYVSTTGAIHDIVLDSAHKEVSVANTKADYSFKLIKQDAKTHDRLANAEFGLFKHGDSPYSETNPAEPLFKFKTNANGVYTGMLSDAGTYDIYELVPPKGYELIKECFEITVTDDKPAATEVIVSDDRLPVKVTIHKVDSNDDKPLTGAKFAIFNKEDLTTKVADVTETATPGTYTASIPAAAISYVVIETEAPDGYVLDTTPHDIVITQESEEGNVIFEAKPLTIVNEKMSCNIEILKFDATSGTKKYLSGAEFAIYNTSGDEVDRITTNTDGKAMSKNLVVGKYTIKETKAPDGYQLNDEEFTAELSSTKKLVTIEVENKPLYGSIKVKKVDAANEATVLSNATFAIYHNYDDAKEMKSAISQCITNSNGIAEFKDLLYGTYYVRETNAPEGYYLSAEIKTVQVNEKSTNIDALPFVFTDVAKPSTGKFSVLKRDIKTHEGLKGAEFTVEKSDGSYKETYTTNENGTFTTNELEFGEYIVTETKPPKGYKLAENPVQTIVLNADSDEESLKLVFDNAKIQGSIEILKIDDSSEQKPLPNATFDVYSLDENGKPNELIERLITGSDGKATSTLLDYGKYVLVEIMVPDGYQLAENNDFFFTIDENSPEVTSKTIVNNAITGSLKLIKKDAFTDERLAGVEFTVYDYDGNKFATLTTNNNGEATLNEIPYGMYYVKETAVPSGYKLNEDFYEVFSIGGKDGKLEYEYTIKNEPIQGQIELVKVDAEEPSIGVAEATYGIYKEAKLNDKGEYEVVEDSYLGEQYDLITKPDIVDPIENKVITHVPVKSKVLDLGTYFVKERKAPEDYEISDDVFKAELKQNDDELNKYEDVVIEVEASDVPKKGRVDILKVDAKDENITLEDAVFAIFTEESYEQYLKDLDEIAINPDANISITEPVVYLRTDKNGKASYDRLRFNENYVLIEYKAPMNCDISDRVERFTPSVQNPTFNYTFENVSHESIIIHKKDENGKPMEGVTFALYSVGADGKEQTDDDQYIDYFRTGFDGKGIATYPIDDLAYGRYYVKETAVGTYGYGASDEIIIIDITPNNHEYEFDFINYPYKGEIELWKVDEAGDPLPGAKFELYKGGATSELEKVMDIELDENQHALIENLDVGYYVIKEVKAPEGYMPINPIPIYLFADGTAIKKDGKVYYHYETEIVNYPITGQIKVQKALKDANGNKIDGNVAVATFEIRNSNNELVSTLITNEKGEAISEILPKGTYSIVETVAPIGSKLDETIGTVVIDGSNTDELYLYEFANIVNTGKFKVLKVDENKNPLQGATFEITNDSTNEVVDTFKTDINGIGTSKELPYGWYTIRETEAPLNYEVDTTTYHRLIGDEATPDVEIEWVNKASSDGKIILVKYDKDNPDKRLSGAKFMITSMDNVFSTEAITNDNGEIVLHNLTPGEYKIVETMAPEGYRLDTTPNYFTVKNQNESFQITLNNELYKGNIIFSKTGELLTGYVDDQTISGLLNMVWKEKDLKDVTIGIYATTTVYLNGKQYQQGDLITELESGETSMDLPLGTYLYKELSAPSDYKLDPDFHTIELTKPETTEKAEALIEMENKHATFTAEVTKQFENSNDSDLYKFVKFGVFTQYPIEYLDDYDVIQEIPANSMVARFGIDENGKSTMQAIKLPEGQYYVQEIATAPGYVLSTRTIPFEIKYGNKDVHLKLTEDNDPIINHLGYGQIKLEKLGDTFTATQITEENGHKVTKPVFTMDYLQGAKVEIRTKSDVTINGVQYEAGALVDTLESGKKEISINLPYGIYLVKEVEAPSGFITDPKEYEVELKYDTVTNKPSLETVTIENHKKDIELSVYKEFYGIDDPTLFSNVVFGIYAAEDIKGSTTEAVLKKDTIVQLMHVDSTGKASIQTQLPAGKYYVKELETADEFAVETQKYPFTVESDSSGIIQIGDVTEDKPIINYPDTGYTPFKFRKIDEEGNPLANATFQLFSCTENHTHDQLANPNESENCWKPMENNPAVTSGEDGIVEFKKLANGEYRLVETAAPNGYVLPEGQWKVTINNEAAKPVVIDSLEGAPAVKTVTIGTSFEYQIENELSHNFKFRKVDPDGLALAGASFQLYRCDDTSSGHTHDDLADIEGNGSSCWNPISDTPIVSDENGFVEFTNLDDGEYRLAEVAAPEGYELPKGQWAIQVNYTDKENPIKITAKGNSLPPAFKKVETSNGSYEYQVINRKKQDLPIMGGTGNSNYLRYGSIMLILAWLLRKRKKEECYGS